MTCNTVCRNAQRCMIGIYALIKICSMTGHTFGRCAGVAITMTLQAIDTLVCASQWEVCGVVIKSALPFTVWMTGETG